MMLRAYFSVAMRGAAGALLLLGMAGAHAQVYKWVDEKGVVHYSDMAPPAQQKVEVKPFSGAAPAPELPFTLAQAAKNHPVTLYTTSQCEACDQGRAMLQARGIPFAEKTVTTADDQEKLKQAGSVGQLPLLVVGSAKVVGYEAGAWHAVLSDAAYPLQRMLPPTYRNSAPEAAAPPRAPAPTQAAARQAAEAAARQALDAARRERPPPLNAAPGFQF